MHPTGARPVQCPRTSPSRGPVAREHLSSPPPSKRARHCDGPRTPIVPTIQPPCSPLRRRENTSRSHHPATVHVIAMAREHPSFPPPSHRAPHCDGARTPLVPTAKQPCTSLRGVVDDRRRIVAGFVYGSKHKSAGTGITERRGNLRDPSHAEFSPRAMSTPEPIPVNENPGSRRLPRRSAPRNDALSECCEEQ